jgi:hypothetical protein
MSHHRLENPSVQRRVYAIFTVILMGIVSRSAREFEALLACEDLAAKIELRAIAPADPRYVSRNGRPYLRASRLALELARVRVGS